MRYRYKAIDTDGMPVDGDMQAENQKAVIEQLHANGLFPLEACVASNSRRRRGDGLSHV